MRPHSNPSRVHPLFSKDDHGHIVLVDLHTFDLGSSRPCRSNWLWRADDDTQKKLWYFYRYLVVRTSSCHGACAFLRTSKNFLLPITAWTRQQQNLHILVRPSPVPNSPLPSRFRSRKLPFVTQSGRGANCHTHWDTPETVRYPSRASTMELSMADHRYSFSCFLSCVMTNRDVSRRI